MTKPHRDRQSARLLSTTMVRAGMVQPVTVHNISSGGVELRTELPPALGEHVIIRLAAHGDVGATVRWRRGRKFGLELDASVDPDIFLARPLDAETPAAAPVSGYVAGVFRPQNSTKRPGLKVC